MNKAKDNSVVKILTDIQIKQSPFWCKKTDYLGDLSPNNALISMIPFTLRKRLRPFLELVDILRFHNQYNVVINANIRTGQLFGLLRGIFKIGTPKHIILELMLDEEKMNPIWKLKKMIQRLSFWSVDIIFVSSANEIQSYSARYGISKDKFRFLPFHTNITEPRMVNGSGNYVLSAGKTGRDYVTLADAVRGLKQKVIIVSDEESIMNVSFPGHVDVLFDIPYLSYLDLLYNCAFVIVPLKKVLKSTGQVAILEAMALGKPVIATETTGTVDYIQSGVNGILVPAEDSGALKEAIRNLTNDLNLSKRLAANGLESVMGNHTFEKYVERILLAANELAERG
jgi:glycosyltransferase involved in cell wall biosynthesis